MLLKGAVIGLEQGQNKQDPHLYPIQEKKENSLMIRTWFYKRQVLTMLELCD